MAPPCLAVAFAVAMGLLLVPLLVALGLAAWQRPTAPRPECSARGARTDAGPALRFLVVGDWGYGPAGHQEFAGADAVANAAAAVATEDEASPVRFVVNVGDNFYAGPASALDGVSGVDDPKWNHTWLARWEPVGLASADVPWLSVVGNHDYKSQDPMPQLRYRHPGWVLPALFFVHERKVGNATLAFVHVDTNLLAHGYGGETEQMRAAFERRGWVEARDAVGEHLAWVRSALEAHRNATFLFVVAHHPLGACGAEGSMVRLLELVLEYRVDAYFAGHVHALQHATMDGTSFVIVGASGNAGVACTSPSEFKAEGVYGFAVAEARPGRVDVEYVDSTGRTLHCATVATAGEP